MQRPVISNLVFSANYNLNSTTFLEGTYGRSRNELAGCALAQIGHRSVVLPDRDPDEPQFVPEQHRPR